ncbi:MAG: EamA family transporter [Anaeromyxobacter sp.]
MTADAPARPAAQPRPRRGRAVLMALVPVVLWGVSFPVTRVTVQALPPLALAALRFLLATAVLWPLARRNAPPLGRADRPRAWALGLLGVTVYFAFENYGLLLTTASHAALIVATVPLVSAAAEAVQRRRAPRPLPVLGMILALAGVAVVVRPDGTGAASPLGDALMLGAMASWVGYTLLARDLMLRYPPLTVTAATMGTGALTLLPLAALEAAFRPLHAPTPAAWGAVAYLGLLCSAAAYLLWNLALPVLGVSLANNLLNGIPLLSVLTGVLLLGEPFTWSLALGGGLVLAGVVLAERTGERG